MEAVNLYICFYQYKQLQISQKSRR